MQTIAIDDDTRVLVLTGAGVSAESGVPTFRDANGLWEGHDVTAVASPEGFAADAALVWRFYSDRRTAAAAVTPNPGHTALAALEARLGDRFLLATQNVDGLHLRAGSTRVVEMHGNLFTTRCAACDLAPFHDAATYYGADALPRCPRCAAAGRSSLLRPHIVWFGEMLNPLDLRRIRDFMRAAEGHRFVFVAAGTSGVVYPAAAMVDQARECGAETWLVNLDVPANRSRFRHGVEGRSGEVLPRLFTFADRPA
jgi:NAD-dependent deacetylase